VSTRLSAEVAGEPGYRALLTLPGVGPVLAGVFFAEIGDVHRFPTPAHLVSWAGLTPRHRESDTTVHRGSITKVGSTLVGWAAVEAVQKTPADAGWLVARRYQPAARRGGNIATIATAGKLLTLVYYAPRDGHVRAPHARPRRHDTSRARQRPSQRRREPTPS
jgi:transposase